jgi:hypothetical protein
MKNRGHACAGGGGENGGSKTMPSGEGSSGGDSSPPSNSVTSDGGLSSMRRHGVLAAVTWGAVVHAGAALARFA